MTKYSHYWRKLSDKPANNKASVTQKVITILFDGLLHLQKLPEEENIRLMGLENVLTQC